MKCTCDSCQGTGEITCLDCDGKGTREGSIETIDLIPSDTNYTELLALRQDAVRVRVEANRLIEMNPSRSDSYLQQLEGTLFIINGQADKLSATKS